MEKLKMPTAVKKNLQKKIHFHSEYEKILLVADQYWCKLSVIAKKNYTFSKINRFIKEKSFNGIFLALLLLYDVTNKTSFDNIRAWLVEIHEYAQDDVVILLLGK